MTDDKPERLSLSDQLYNLNAGWWVALVALAQFSIAINRNRKPGQPWATPKAITTESYATGDAPAGVAAVWQQYGIAACCGSGIIVIEQGHKCHYLTHYVSSRQHWMADRVARAAGFCVVSPAVVNARGVSSQVDAERGAWKASGRVRRSLTWEESLRHGIGDMVGTRQTYVKRALAAPGLRAAKQVAKPRGFWRWLLGR